MMSTTTRRRIRPSLSRAQVSPLRPYADRVIKLLAAGHGTDAVEAVIEQAVTTQTEALRGALAQMLAFHNRRFPLSGTCHCDACAVAKRLVGSQN